MVCVVIYGASIAGLGLTSVLWLGVLFLALSGAADIVSSVYRNTILQVATPDAMRGRLQGVFIVVVAGGPRLGDFTVGLGRLADDRVLRDRGRRLRLHDRCRAPGAALPRASPATTPATPCRERRAHNRALSPQR